MTPGSIAPGRVPMQSPSSAVNPSVLSTLFPSFIAQRLAPLPRCATITRPCAISGATVGRTDAMYSVREPVESVALHAAATEIARQRHDLGDRRLAAMKARVETGDLRHARQSLGHGIDCGEVVRLMERRERHQGAEVRQDLRRDDRRPRVLARRRGRRDGRRRARGRRRRSASEARRQAHRRPRVRPRSCSKRSSARRAPAPSLAENRGDDPMPSIWPRTSTFQAVASDRR